MGSPPWARYAVELAPLEGDDKWTGFFDGFDGRVCCVELLRCWVVLLDGWCCVGICGAVRESYKNPKEMHACKQHAK
jgi:hypothetical protein